MSSQSRADAYLAAWQLLRHLPPLLRMALIDTLCEIERARLDRVRHSVTYANRVGM